MLNSIIYTILNVPSITNLLGTYKTTKKALFSDVAIPQDCTATATINFYYSESYSAAESYNQLVYTINCRAYTMAESQTIAQAVKAAINRVNGPDYYISVEVLPTISPVDDRDNYNSTIQATIKKRG
jgi:hypothetical protein